MTDLLLLNASNFPQFPIYPYAFVQVRAVARQYGLRVAGHDLLGVPQERWLPVLEDIIGRLRPRMVGLHLRQADSVMYKDYADGGADGYFPLDDTARLARLVRRVTDVPIVVGGFGFTTHAQQLFEHLQVDYGCRGEPNALLGAFETLGRGERLEAIDNLLFSRAGETKLSPRTFFAPLDDREYDEEVFAELEAFYGRPVLHGNAPPTVAVELARGCPFRCSFCTEPAVKGRSVRVRNLDAVLDDVGFLASKQIRRFWLVCSELNIKDSELALKVAERFLRINERRPTAPLKWHAYHLPRWLSRSDLALLYRSGYAGGWNDFPSLDDENLRKNRVPYRARHAVEHLENTLALQPRDGESPPPKLSLFLGNRDATPSTVARTLQVVADHQFAERFPSATVSSATRIFAPEGKADLERAVTFGREGRSGADSFIHPTFVRPQALETALGGEQELLEFFHYVESTLISSEYRSRLDWRRFLASAAPLSWTEEQLRRTPSRRPAGLPGRLAASVSSVLDRLDAEPASLGDFLVKSEHSEEVYRYVTLVLVHRITWPVPEHFKDVLDWLGIRHDARGRLLDSTYVVWKTLLNKFPSNRSLLTGVSQQFALEDPGRELWLLKCILFERNVRLEPAYRRLLFVQSEDRQSSTGGVATFSRSALSHG